MRIISGTLGGRRLMPPAKMPYTRPTTDIAKEGLFNILHHQLGLGELKTLDLFGGTGSISFELASRGAVDLTVVEKDPSMFNFIKKTAGELKLENFKVVKMDAFKFLEQETGQYDLIFAGPPYSLENIDDLPKVIFERKILKPGGWFVLEHTTLNSFKEHPLYTSERNYGTTIFSFFISP